MNSFKIKVCFNRNSLNLPVCPTHHCYPVGLLFVLVGIYYTILLFQVSVCQNGVEK